jgi:serine/threonine-protein kinase HipA
MSERHGAVWYGERRVGALRDAGAGRLYFRYDAAWLDSGGFPISIRLPVSLGEEEVEARAFFEGLLPEGSVRDRICRQLGIAREDDAGLLFAIGEDCAGALSVLPAGAEPQSGQTPARALTAGEVDRLIRTRGEDTAVITDGTRRFSLAGVHEKQPVIFDGEAYALPDRANPSSHILKFETVPRVCFAEFMANDMARRLELPVVACEFLRSTGGDDAVPYLRIERYDRERQASGALVRLHQEDVLQALGEPTVFKYQSAGGPSLARIAGLLREHTARPVEALGWLRDWQIFNYLVGNWDGHGKNLALLYPPGEAAPVLAPFYDLVAIEFLNLVRPGSWSRDIAFYIGEHDVPEQITRADWEAFARQLGMPPKRVLARLEELTGRMGDLARDSRQAFAASQGDEPVYDRFEESIRRRCRRTLNSVFHGK